MSDFTRVKDAIRLESFIPGLKKSGRNYLMCCPLHSEKSPSFVVNPETQSWRCYGACAKGGDVFDFVMARDHLSYAEALQSLADYAHVSPSPRTRETVKAQSLDERLGGLLTSAMLIYTQALYAPHDKARAALSYLVETRGLTPQILQTFHVGYASLATIMTPLRGKGYTDQEMYEAGLLSRSDEGRLYDRFRNRIVFPICDDKGQVRGFGARAMGDEQPKYLNSPQSDAFDKSSLLYGLHRAKGTIRQAERCIVVEGYMDCLQAHQAGYTNVVAQMGTAFTRAQLDTLAKLNPTMIFALDSDAAGQNATRRIAEEHIKSGLDLRLLAIEGGKDPDDMIKASPDAWGQAVNDARPLVDVLIEVAVTGLSKHATVLEKQKIVKALSPLLKVADNAPYTVENMRKLAFALSLPEGSLLRPELTVLRPIPKPASMPSALEMAALHNILVNDDDRWIDRANAKLMCACPEDLPYALAPLSPVDFIHPLAQRLMGLIVAGQRSGQASIDLFVQEQSRGTDVEGLYDRLQYLPTIEAIFAADVKASARNDSYETFVSQVVRLRDMRLKNDMAALSGLGDEASLLRWDECSRARAALCQLSSVAGKG